MRLSIRLLISCSSLVLALLFSFFLLFFPCSILYPLSTLPYFSSFSLSTISTPTEFLLYSTFLTIYFAFNFSIFTRFFSSNSFYRFSCSIICFFSSSTLCFRFCSNLFMNISSACFLYYSFSCSNRYRNLSSSSAYFCFCYYYLSRYCYCSSFSLVYKP